MKSPPLEGFTVEWGLTARLVINKFNFPCSSFKKTSRQTWVCVAGNVSEGSDSKGKVSFSVGEIGRNVYFMSTELFI